EGTKVIGRKRLRTEPLMKPHRPQKYGNKTIVQSQFKEVRLAILDEFKRIDALCRKIYEQWKRGDFSSSWPPGTFPPPLPPQANALG
ncbi:MAG: hypothetical protein KDD44_10100, partial [Bdellovibrionales bacterium]|nr:hypothetical protein [Bdellovibrionales bacterium]